MKRVCVVMILLYGAGVGAVRAGAIIIDHNCIDLSVIPEDSVTAAASLRLLLRHASVGQGIGWGLDCLAGLKPTNASCSCFPPGEYDRTNWVLEARMGNGQSKTDDLVTQTNARADEFDVLTMKYCYIDALGDHHPDWEYYRTQMEQLEAQYPDKRFVWWTIPLTRDGQPGTDVFNALVRSYCAANAKILFDIADIECHDPSGVKQTNAQGDETICQDYTKEIHAGHLNVEGRIRVASALWRLMAAIADDEPPAADPRTIIYVDDDANAPGDGSSWETAYRFLQDALADANDWEKPVEIRVAQGMYRPDQGADQAPGDREATVQLLDGVTLQGGYAGLDGMDPNARDIDRYETILSGDLFGNDISVSDPCDLLHEPSRDDNSYHVVTATGTEPSAVIDGFTITAGTAKAVVPPPPQPMYSPEGAGMYVESGSPTVVNCRFAWNLAGDGGAIYATTSNLTLVNCTFTSNMAGRVCTTLFVGRDPVIQCRGGYGGAVHIASGSPRMSRCIFTDNSATYGGGVSNGESSPLLEDCQFLRNGAYRGGGVYSAMRWSSPKLVRCTFRGNGASGYGGGMANESASNVELVDCIFAENWAQAGGGAINNSLADLSLVTCTVARNRTPQRGGAMRNSKSVARLFNCVLSGNVAVSSVFGAGAMYNEHSNTLTLVNCTIVGNSGQCANGFRFSDRNPSTMHLTNCIVRNGGREIANENNSMIRIEYTNLTDGWPGEGNMDVDPCFASVGYFDPNATTDDPNDDVWVDGDYHLKSQASRLDPTTQNWVEDDITSPCIDAGDPNSPIGYEPFPNGGRINMGAYGGTAEASKSPFGE